jgi:MFS family permease
MRFLKGGLKISGSRFASISLLNLGTLAWFFILIFYMAEIFATMTPNYPDWGLYVGNSLFFGFAIFWSITISFIGGRINRRKLLFTSIILGIFSTVLLGLLEGTFFASILSSLMGMSLGLGLPSSMALVADYTVIENRGRVSGIVIFSTFVIAFAGMAIYRMLNLDVLGLILLLAFIRSISLFGLVVDKFERPSTIGKKKTLLSVTAYKEFFFYLCPWVIFSIASSLAWTLIPATKYSSEVYIGNTLRYVFIAVFGLAAGFIADRFGRKVPIIFGLATLGIGYLLLGFNMSGISVIVYCVLSGITWGLFFVVFLAVPGDLSIPSSREKFYALGYILPLTGVLALSVIPVPFLPDILPPSLIAQILGICLFLAMYPVFRAKETLAESKIQERKMKEYVERVGKTIQETEENK